MLTRARGVTAGRLAKAASVNIETIRYYETIGLMPVPSRTQSGHRTYDKLDIRRLSFIRRGRELGFGVEEVRGLLALDAPQGSSCALAKDIAVSLLEKVRGKLADLARLEAILAESIAQCTSAPMSQCPVLDMLEPKPVLA